MRGNPAFGQWLKECRARHDITQDMLAREVGCACSTIKKIEIGALRPSRQVAELLADRLGIRADQRATWMWTARHSADPMHAVTQRSAMDLLDTLPAPIPLIGREHDLAQICTMLGQPELRLLTLTGAPGVGKTRLAIAAAAAIAPAFADGACYVSLAAVSDPAAMIAAIGQSLGLHETLRLAPGEAIAAFLRDRQLLLILDNLEQIVDAAPALADLLARTPRVTMLATSRVALLLAGEQIYPTAPLALPTATSASIAASPAVALFVQRAQKARASFELTAHNAHVVAAICRRLDGLPLAIELAAARIAVRSAGELLQDLECPLPLLTHGARDLPQRQRTLRAAIGWSEQLLVPEQRRLFRALAVFSGGCTLAAASALFDPDGEPASVPHALLDHLQALVNANLVQVAETNDGELRFVLLEMIHAYAREQLEQAGETELLRQRHARYYLRLAELAAPQLRSAAQLAWLQRLDQDADNLRAALLWSFASEPSGADSSEAQMIGAHLAVALWYYWFLRGRLREAHHWLDRAAALPVEPSLCATALVSSGIIRYYSGGYAPVGQAALDGLALARQLGLLNSVALALATFGHALASSAHEALLLAQALSDPWMSACVLAEQSVRNTELHGRAADAAQGLALAQLTGDRWLIARLHWVVGMAVLDFGRPAEAEQHLIASLRLQQEIGNQLGVAYALLGRSIVAWARADLRHAYTHQQARLEIERDLGNDAGVAHTLGSLGDLALIQAEYTQAQAKFSESLALYTVLADVQGCIRIDLQRARIDLECGRYQNATARLQECLHQAHACAYAPGIGFALELLGTVAMARGELDDAATLLQESMARAQSYGNQYALAANLYLCGELARQQGRYQDAIRMLGQSVVRYRAVGSLPCVASAAAALGWAFLDAGDLQQAQTLLTESLSCFNQLNARNWAAGALEGLAAVAAESKRWAEALSLWDAAEALRKQCGAQRWLVDDRLQRQRQNLASEAYHAIERC